MTPQFTNDDTPLDPAEALDGETLGERPDDDRLPGVNAYTDRPHMLNAEDPSLMSDGSVTDDNEDIRSWRETSEDPLIDGDNVGMRFAAAGEGSVPTFDDGEPELLADDLTYTDNPTAEEAAMHIEQVHIDQE